MLKPRLKANSWKWEINYDSNFQPMSNKGGLRHKCFRLERLGSTFPCEVLRCKLQPLEVAFKRLKLLQTREESEAVKWKDLSLPWFIKVEIKTIKNMSRRFKDCHGKDWWRKGSLMEEENIPRFLNTEKAKRKTILKIWKVDIPWEILVYVSGRFQKEEDFVEPKHDILLLGHKGLDLIGTIHDFDLIVSQRSLSTWINGRLEITYGLLILYPGHSSAEPLVLRETRLLI